MATGPTIEVLVDWRQAGFALISNDGFETNTTGWSTGASINAAATSLTRTTGDKYVGVACAQMVTTGTNGSGVNFDFGSTTFTSGRTYRFRVYLKSVSGTTSYRILIGSLGTAGDRASLTGTLTTSWAAYTVTWTPSGNRTDVEAIVTNNAASIMTANIDAAEVWETIDDISADVLGVSYGRGASFDGATEAPGFAVLTLDNSTQKYDPDNGASSLTGLLKLGRKVWIRATWATPVTAPLFYGTIRRIVLSPATRRAEFHCLDAFDDFGRYEVNVSTSQTRSIKDFRVAVLAAMGVSATNYSLATGVESNFPTTWADTNNGLAILEAVNVGTATAHYIAPSASNSVLWQYITKERTSLAASSSSESWNGVDITNAEGFDYSDETVQNTVRVTANPRGVVDTGLPAVTLWDAADILPWSLPNGTSVTFYTAAADPIISPTLAYATSPTVSLSTAGTTSYGHTHKIVLTNSSGTDAAITQLYALGYLASSATSQTAVVTDATSVTTYGARQPATVTSDYLVDQGDAEGLGAWLVLRYKDPKPRPTITRVNEFPSVMQREITETIALTVSRTSASAAEYLIRTMRHDIEPGMAWTAQYGLEQAPGTGITFFQLDTAGHGITDGHLGY